MNKQVLIITGGHIDEAFLKEHMLKESYSLIIAADRGLESLDRLGISPDHIVGDFDSISQDLLISYSHGSTKIHRFPKEKDKTDTEIAIDLALMHKAVKINLIGATGSRIDHTLANIHLLMEPLELGIEANILDEHNKVYLKKEGFTINKDSQYGRYVSLIAFYGPVEGLVLKGFKYTLDGVRLNIGNSLGISNEIVDKTAKIQFSSGFLLVAETLD